MDTAPAAKAASVFAPGPATPSAAASGSGGASWILVIVAIVVMLGLIVALGYLVYDYFAYKKAATAAAEQDRKTSLAHDRYIIDKANSVSGTLNSNVRVVPVPLKLKDVRARLLEVIGEEQGEEIIEKVFAGDRPLVEKRSLRRIVPKVSMSLDL